MSSRTVALTALVGVAVIGGGVLGGSEIGRSALGSDVRHPMVPLERPRVHVVAISAFRFRPARLKASVGDTVVWINRDIVAHTATSDGHEIDSGDLATGARHDWVVREGTQAYHCVIHTEMRGVVEGRQRSRSPAGVDRGRLTGGR